MNRREFTDRITLLIREMLVAGEQPIFDYVLRSAAEQNRLFNEGLSKCDGTVKISAHQKGTAADIYLCRTGADGTTVIDFEWDPFKAEKWHRRWQELGGREMIEWDKPHFE